MHLTAREKSRVAAVFSAASASGGTCPVKDIIAGLGDKWSIYSLLLLGQHGTMRFNELRRNISGISQRMLTVTLRALERDGMVSRTINSETPLRVEYQLTQTGESLLQQILQLIGWAEAHAPLILKSRKVFLEKNRMKTQV